MSETRGPRMATDRVRVPRRTPRVRVPRKKQEVA
ncbi:hypothetical protein SAXI111661_01675 [Saccharomonospora xinjiangensis]|nr:hypothetical protein EYD13_19050 [Saccharomonospora xinjiangensis]